MVKTPELREILLTADSVTIEAVIPLLLKALEALLVTEIRLSGYMRGCHIIYRQFNPSLHTCVS